MGSRTTRISFHRNTPKRENDGGCQYTHLTVRGNFAVYLCVAKILRNKYELKHSDSYDDAAFVTEGPTQLKTCNDNIFVPVLAVQYI